MISKTAARMNFVPSIRPSISSHHASYRFSLYVALALCALPIIAVFVPRFMAFAPGIIGVLGLVGVVREHGSVPRFNVAALVVPVLILALMSISSLWAIDTDVALKRVGKASMVLFGGVVFFHFAINANAKIINYFQNFFPLAVLFAGFLLVLDLYFNAFLYNALHSDVLNNFSVFNRSVIIFLFSSMIALWCLFYARSWTGYFKKAALLGLSAVILMVLFKTDSQSAQMAFVLAAIIFTVFPYISQRALCLVVALAIAIFICATPWLAQALFQYFTPYILDVDWFRNGYAADRMEIWDFVVRRALEQPIIGHGVEATRVIKDFDTQRLFHPASEVLHPHNFAAQIWIEFGALGALMFTGIFAYFLRVISRLDAVTSRLALMLLIACVSVASTGYGLWQSWWLGTFSIVIVGIVFVQKMLQQNQALDDSKT